MATKIGINGFGRIGRNVFKLLMKAGDFEVVGINDLTDAKTLAHLLKYDSVFGVYDADVSSTEDAIVVNGKAIKVTAIKEPSEIPWKAVGADMVLESTGRFTTKEACLKHVAAGAKKVLLSVPPKDAVDAIIVVGVNCDTLKPTDVVVSNASCTTNCLAPMAKVLHENFGIKRGLMTTVHAYTNDQQVLDMPHKDLRRARACALSMIPTTTGAARAIAEVIPEMKGRLDGLAVRVPTPNVSLVDFVATLARETDRQQVNDKLREYSQKAMKGILLCSEEELVSKDFNGNPHSSIVDLPNTTMIGGKMVKILSWYDNEWGFSNRMLELLSFIMK